jgi:uncharacterized membrane protein
MTNANELSPYTGRGRINSIDILRGIVMVLMAIDHVRVYSGIPSWEPTYGVFFTRWVTNFCAPAFVFLAGTSAFVYAEKIKNKKTLARFLIGRGLLLVVLELTLIRFFWTFNFNFANFTLAGIIWMLGWCMVIMAALIPMKPPTIGVTGLIIVAGQEGFAYLPKLFPVAWQPSIGHFWEFFYPSGLQAMPGFTVLYVLIPWIGVMAAGYGFGRVFFMEPQKRKKICIYLGVSAIALFLIIASIIAFNQKNGNEDSPFIFKLLGQRKYPASVLFLLMTLGPLITAIPFAEKMKGIAGKVFSTFGRVPLFYYILHILVIHLGSLLLNYFREGTLSPGWYDRAPFVELDPQHRWSLGLLYFEFICDVVFLYWLCSMYAKYKEAHPNQSWLKYL